MFHITNGIVHKDLEKGILGWRGHIYKSLCRQASRRVQVRDAVVMDRRCGVWGARGHEASTSLPGNLEILWRYTIL